MKVTNFPKGLKDLKSLASSIKSQKDLKRKQDYAKSCKAYLSSHTTPDTRSCEVTWRGFHTNRIHKGYAETIRSI